jgi:hypothetical protein
LGKCGMGGKDHPCKTKGQGKKHLLHHGPFRG